MKGKIVFGLLGALFFGSMGTALLAEEKLDGAKVFAANCAKCHPERQATERSDAKWEIIVTHMRIRSQLTASEAEAVLDYLQANNED